MGSSFIDRIVRAPLVYDKRVAEIAWERLTAASDAALLTDARVKPLLDGVFGNSPFLTRIVLREAAWLAQALLRDPDTVLTGLITDMGAEVARAADAASAMKVLRIARNRAAMLIALADLGGVFDLTAVTRALTQLADAALKAALRRLLTEAATRGQFRHKDPSAPEIESGLIVLAMGKYGAFELNYSSDIDLIALYDRAALRVTAGTEPGPFAVKLVQDLTQMLQRRTDDGYVFRVDLRLRPDGNASPVAMSTDSAELYYESAGQNWERAAMIKARACAGDIAAGERFLSALRPYIWRKHLDFAAIDDIHSIKRQIHVHKGFGDAAVLGHNIKLGRGGIREIEFFAQTQQLILGGRDAALRVRATRDALSKLAEKGHITREVQAQLTESYEFLRNLEHRLQMIEDEQTHTLPKTQDGIDHVARFSGFADTAEFERVLRAHLERVQGHYAQLFESSETLASDAGSLVFTGVDDDPETIGTLTRLGFKRASAVSATVRAWHHGRINATHSARAREGLTKLVPLMLQSLSRAPDPDAAFIEFERFVAALPTGVQLFSMLVANPQILDLLTELFSLAPRLSRVLAARPNILDALLGRGEVARAALPPLAGEVARRAEGGLRSNAPSVAFSDTSPMNGGGKLDAELARSMAGASSLEEKLDQARIFASERQFRIAVRVLKVGLDAEAAGAAFTATAEAVIRALLDVTEAEMQRRHGRIEGGAWAVLGMGKLGGREMTATSDLDLVFVYEFDSAREMSSGPRVVSAGEYFARAGQRLISLLTVPTRQGKLYEVDMRLRPSGRAGPVAVTLERLKSYHESGAWTFEHMALTRARFVAGSPELGARAEAIIKDVLTADRDVAKVAADALDMRTRLAAAKPVTDPWALKQGRGGLIDLEYIAQVLQLAFAPVFPKILSTSTVGALENVDLLGLLPREDIDALLNAARFFARLSQVMQICYDEERAPTDAALNVRTRLAAILGAPSYEALEARLIATEQRVKALFDQWVGDLPKQIRPGPSPSSG